MKKTLTLLTMVILLCGFRMPDGDIVTDGDPVDKLLTHMGQPLMKTPDGVITEINQVTGGYVTKVISEIWVYKIDKITYRFKIQGGVIDSITWSR